MKVHRHLIESVIEALTEIFAGRRHADRVVGDFLQRHPKWGSRDRRMFAGTVYEVVRWWRWFAYLAGEEASAGKPDAARIRRIWAAYWLEEGHELPDFAAADDLAVSLRQRKAAPVSRAIRASIPDWLDAAGEAELGGAWPGILEILNEPAPVFLRVNSLRSTPGKVIAALAGEGIGAAPVAGLAGALRLETRRNLRLTRAYREGLFEIQDVNSQRIAGMLDVAPGMTVVDVCAGAGGKTLQLAEAMKGEGRLVAMDVHAPKLDELLRRAKRAGAARIETRCLREGAAASDLTGRADRVLLDVPCSGSGVLRRMPDTKWKLRPADLDRLRATQAEILRERASLVRPGGVLVYATCSIFPSENSGRVRAFLREAAGWTLGTERTLPPESGGGDGFYAARLVRSGSPG